MSKKPTVTGLQADLKAANDEAKGYLEQRRILEQQNHELEKELKESRMNFADLKQRLLAAEQSNQFMRGYLARVQEDDTVREDLVTIGEPEGEQRMVPKRKPTTFERPDDFTMPAHHDRYGGFMNEDERRRKARHWITY